MTAKESDESEQIKGRVWGDESSPEECPACHEEFEAAFRTDGQFGKLTDGELCYWRGMFIVHDLPLVLEGERPTVTETEMTTPDEGHLFEVPYNDE